MEVLQLMAEGSAGIVIASACIQGTILLETAVVLSDRYVEALCDAAGERHVSKLALHEFWSEL